MVIASVIISVPSSSGKSLQQPPLIHKKEHSSISVPSSSGKSLQRLDELGRELQALSFQSPLHRGSLFNRGLDGNERARLVISVPSSSGKSLQPPYLGDGPACRVISVPSSSGKSLQRGEGNRKNFYRHISVPSSSGKSLQLLKPSLDFVGSPYFSPLFIGEVSSTPRSCGKP